MDTLPVRYAHVTYVLNTFSTRPVYVSDTLEVRCYTFETRYSYAAESPSVFPTYVDVWQLMSCVWVTCAERTASVPLAYAQRITNTSAYVANFVHAHNFWQPPTYDNVWRRISAYPQRVQNVPPAYSTYASVFAIFLHTSAYAGSYVVVWQGL